MRIAIASDHAAFDFKAAIIEYLTDELGHEVADLGPYSAERTDYPIYAEKVSKGVVAGDYDRGFVFCGSGIGISIAANKIPGVRCVVCSEPYSAVLSRNHNNTNLLAMGSRVVGIELAKMIVSMWLEADFEGGRHQGRLDEIASLEEGGTCGV